MEPIIQVRSKFSRDDYKKYLRLVTFKGSPTTLPALILIPLLLSILIPYGLSNIGDQNQNIFSLKAIVFLYLPFLAISFGVVFLRLFMTNLKMKLVDTENIFDTYNSFKFYEDRVTVENDKVEGINPIKYANFYRVLESDQYFILYFSDIIVSIIRKSDLEDEKELGDFLKRKLGKKYRRI